MRLPESQMEEAADYVVMNMLNVAQTEEFIDEIVLRNQMAKEDSGQVSEVVAERTLPEAAAAFASETAEPPQEKKSGRKLMVVKDLRIFTNTISRAIEMMKQAGIQACSQKREEEEFIEYVVRIPKESAYQRRSSL